MAEEDAGAAGPPHPIQTRRWRNRLQNPEKSNEKAKKPRPGEALECEDSTVLLPALQFAPWHRHSLSRILIRQSLKLGSTKN